MTKLKPILTIVAMTLSLLIGSEVSFASYQTQRYNPSTGQFETVTLPGDTPYRLRRQSNDLFSQTYKTYSIPQVTRPVGTRVQTRLYRPTVASVPTTRIPVARTRTAGILAALRNPGRSVPAGATQDPQGRRTISCRNPQGDFACMACNCQNEAAHRWDDQISVSKVVMTRVQLREFPNTVCGVVKQYKQFSWFNSFRTRRPVPANSACMKATTEALKFRGYFADHYHADYVKPRWRRNMQAVAQVGVHIYYSRFSPADMNTRGSTTVAGL
jgi:hypothetical protein